MEKTFLAFGTINYIKIEDNNSSSILEKMVEIALSLDNTLSVFKAESEISKINQQAGRKAVKVSPSTLRLLEQALYFSKISHGAFDITIRPAIKLWGIGSKEQRIPTLLERNEIKALVNYNQLKIDTVAGTAFLKKKGQAIDLGGIAKGYAADIIRKKLVESGIHNGILNFGGSILTICQKINENPWTVGIQNPLAKRGESIGTLHLKNDALVTSAVNERFFIQDGIRYHHLLDPSTLAPSQSGVLSVSAMGKSAMELDALTTAMFVMGLEKGIQLAQKTGIEAIFLLDSGSIYATNGFKNGKIRLLNLQKKSII